mgnify:CR=1 FL=1
MRRTSQKYVETYSFVIQYETEQYSFNWAFVLLVLYLSHVVVDTAKNLSGLVDSLFVTPMCCLEKVPISVEKPFFLSPILRVFEFDHFLTSNPMQSKIVVWAVLDSFQCTTLS